MDIRRQLNACSRPWAQTRRSLARQSWNVGVCPVCETSTIFVEEGAWLRDQYRCLRCRSIPRHRALMSVLHRDFPSWRNRRDP